MLKIAFFWGGTRFDLPPPRKGDQWPLVDAIGYSKTPAFRKIVNNVINKCLTGLRSSCYHGNSLFQVERLRDFSVLLDMLVV